MSDTSMMHRKWVIEFWDFEAWNVGAHGSWDKKSEAITECQKMNRNTTHEERTDAYEGHRFRVRINPDWAKSEGRKRC